MGFLARVRDMIAPTKTAAPLAPRSEYLQGGRGVIFQGRRPALRDSADEVATSWAEAAARATDTIHNSGWIAGAIDQAVANVVGTGLRLECAPENAQFGMSEEEARKWSGIVEQRWGLFANSPIECDIEGRRTIGQMQAAVLRSYFATGEAFAEIPWRKRNTYGTKVRLVQSHRISQNSNSLNNTVQGVRMDADGFPVGYVAQKKDPLFGEREWLVPRFDQRWRPRVVHCFDGMPGQVRGITPLVPALRVAKQFDQLADATLTGAILQTVFAATITGDAPTEEVLQGFLTSQEQAELQKAGKSGWDAMIQSQIGWYDSTTIDVGINGRIAHLFPGQKMEFLTPSHSASDYREFSLHLLREIARCLGLTYETTTGDYEGATYSSVRMAGGEIYALTLYRRAFIIVPFCQAVYEAWLEEEIEAGTIPFPGGIEAFHANRAAVCRALWKGSQKQQADDYKTASAHKLWRDMGVMSDEMIANDLGIDIEDVYAQRAREAELRKSLGLKDPQEQKEALAEQQFEAQRTAGAPPNGD